MEEETATHSSLLAWRILMISAAFYIYFIFDSVLAKLVGFMLNSVWIIETDRLLLKYREVNSPIRFIF